MAKSATVVVAPPRVRTIRFIDGINEEATMCVRRHIIPSSIRFITYHIYHNVNGFFHPIMIIARPSSIRLNFIPAPAHIPQAWIDGRKIPRGSS